MTICVGLNGFFLFCVSSQGMLCRTLNGHGHWVNTLSLHTDYVLRTGAYEPGDPALHHRGLEGMNSEWVW